MKEWGKKLRSLVLCYSKDKGETEDIKLFVESFLAEKTNWSFLHKLFVFVILAFCTWGVKMSKVSVVFCAVKLRAVFLFNKWHSLLRDQGIAWSKTTSSHVFILWHMRKNCKTKSWYDVLSQLSSRVPHSLQLTKRSIAWKRLKA